MVGNHLLPRDATSQGRHGSSQRLMGLILSITCDKMQRRPSTARRNEEGKLTHDMDERAYPKREAGMFLFMVLFCRNFRCVSACILYLASAVDGYELTVVFVKILGLPVDESIYSTVHLLWKLMHSSAHS